MNIENQNNLKDLILKKIDQGETKMKPKWYFLLKAVLFFMVTLMVTVFIVCMISLVAFSIRQSGVMFAPSFGWSGVGLLMISLPWILILSVFIFVVLLEVLVKKYSFAYKRPVLISLGGILFIVFISGFIFHKTGVHYHFSSYSKSNDILGASQLYDKYGPHMISGVHRGFLREVLDDGFLFEGSGQEIKVLVSPETRFPLGIDLAEGDEVFVWGQEENNELIAFGIRRIGNLAKHKRSSDKNYFKLRMMGNDISE